MAIFLSHAHKDVELARAIAAELRARGSEVWVAEDMIRPGDLFSKIVETALREATGMIVLITPAISEASNQWFEIGAGIGRSLEMESYRIVPVLVNGSATEDLPPHLFRLQSLDLSSETDPHVIAEKVANSLTAVAAA